jgi:hypothetical protein
MANGDWMGPVTNGGSAKDSLTPTLEPWRPMYLPGRQGAT